jgi:hypothetical protein
MVKCRLILLAIKGKIRKNSQLDLLYGEGELPMSERNYYMVRAILSSEEDFCAGK